MEEIDESCVGPIRTIVVDDAPLMRKVIPDILNKHSDINVVGTAANGRECLEKIPDLKPHVVTLDIDMPVMNGITTIKNIMVRHQIPIVIISSMIQDGYFAFEALRLGVVDFIPKPSGPAVMLDADEDLIRRRVRAAFGMQAQCVRRVRRKRMPAGHKTADSLATGPVVVIGTTLAGPNSIMRILSQFEHGFAGTVICMQEIHPSILAPFCSCFHQVTALDVLPLTGPCELRPGCAYMASTFSGAVIESDSGNSGRFWAAPGGGSESAIDTLFESAANHFGGKACGVLLSGLGSDGAEGMRKIKSRGGLTLAQQRDGCIFPSMVEHAMQEGVVDASLPIDAMARELEIWAIGVGDIYSHM